jgi:hypothetical protein
MQLPRRYDPATELHTMKTLMSVFTGVSVCGNGKGCASSHICSASSP